MSRSPTSLPYDPERQGAVHEDNSRRSTAFYVDGVNVVRTSRPCLICGPPGVGTTCGRVRRPELLDCRWQCRRCGATFDVHDGTYYGDDRLLFSDAFHHDRAAALALWDDRFRPCQARRLLEGDEVAYREPPDPTPLTATVTAVRATADGRLVVAHSAGETIAHPQDEVWRRLRDAHIL